MMSLENKRQQLYSLLGDLPIRNEPPSAKKLQEIDQGHFILETLLLQDEDEIIPALFARPKQVEGELPVVLFNHSHGGNYHVGKTELIQSSDYLQKPAFAEELTSMGYGVLCLDMIGFGERRGKSESEIFKEMLWKGQVMWGRMIFDNMRGLDYLMTREDVDKSRVATLGMSMGGLMAWWISALDERIKVCIDIAAQVDAETLIANRGLDHHGFYSYVPGLLKYFSTSDIQRLIVPRHHLSVVGDYDKLTPFTGLSIIDEELSEEYKRAGISERWKMVRFPCGHIETAGMRVEVCSFLKKYL
jgi:dienelactone hydrolase